MDSLRVGSKTTEHTMADDLKKSADHLNRFLVSLVYASNSGVYSFSSRGWYASISLSRRNYRQGGRKHIYFLEQSLQTFLSIFINLSDILPLIVGFPQCAGVVSVYGVSFLQNIK